MAELPELWGKQRDRGSTPRSSGARRGGPRPAHSTPRSGPACSTHSASTPSSCSPRSRSATSPAARTSTCSTAAPARSTARWSRSASRDPRLKAVGYLPLNDPAARRRTARRRHRRGHLRDLDAVGCAGRLLARARRPRPDLGPHGRGPRPVRAARRRRQAAAEGVPQQRPAPTEGLAGRRREPAGQGLPGAAPLARAVPGLPGLDGVFERHPDLRGAAIELGASWVPGMLRNLDHAAPLVRQVRAAAAGAVDCCRRTTSAAR